LIAAEATIPGDQIAISIATEEDYSERGIERGSEIVGGRTFS
jgi:hypothetical protein